MTQDCGRTELLHFKNHDFPKSEYNKH